MKAIFQYLTFALAVFLGLTFIANAQVSIPYTFTANTTIRSSEVNSNFSTLGSNALNRTGGTVSGNLASSGGTLSGSWGGSPTFTGNPLFSGTAVFSTSRTFSSGLTAPSLSVSSGITAGTPPVGIINSFGKIPAISTLYFSVPDVDAALLTSGTVPNGRFPATLPAVNGSLLTNLSAANLTGTISTATQAAISNPGNLQINNAAYLVSYHQASVTASSSVTLGGGSGLVIAQQVGAGTVMSMCFLPTLTCTPLGSGGTVSNIDVHYTGGGSLEIQNISGGTIGIEGVYLAVAH